MKITHKSYTDKEVKWLVRHFGAELRAVRDAVNKVEANYATYREQQNEWRGQIRDQSANFASKQEITALNRFMYMMAGALLVIQFIGIGGIILIIKYIK